MQMEDAACAASTEVGCQPHLAKKVAACFVSQFFTSGPIYSFGVFLPFIQADLGVSLPEVSAIGSSMNTAQFAGAFLAGLIIPQRAGHASVAIFGAVGVLIGLASLSMIKNPFAAYPAAILAGLCLGSSNLAGIVALNAAVPAKKRATFVGFATCGTSVGTILLPQFYTLLTESIGWRWVMRITAAVSCVFLAAAAPFFTVEGASPRSLLSDRPTSGNREAEPVEPTELGIQDVVQDPRFLCWWLDMLVCFFGYFIPATLLAEFAKKELQLSPNLAALCYSLVGVSALIGKLSSGCLTHFFGGPRRLFFASQVLVGAVGCCLPFCWNAASLLVWSAVYGCGIGPVIAMISVVLSDLFGTKDLALYHGVSRTAEGAGNLIGIPLLSLLAEKQGFTIALVLSGALVSFSTVFLILLELVQRRKQRLPSAEESRC